MHDDEQKTIDSRFKKQNTNSLANKERQRCNQLTLEMCRSTFLTMEPYFNDVCEAYYIQTNGNDFPSVSELACLYFNLDDELEAVAYLLGIK